MNIKEKNNFYWSWRAKTYSIDQQQALHDERKKYWKSELQTIFQIYATGKSLKEIKVLDIGTGPGFFAILASELGAQVTAVDYTQAMLDEAKINAGEYAEKIIWIKRDVENLFLEEGSFDILITRNLTWNLPNPKKAYQEWFYILKKGGLLINYDANWYHYLFDEKKKEEFIFDRLEAKLHKVEDCNVGYGFEKMEEIAKKIPLGKEDRPAWDLKIMEQIGYTELNVDKEIWKKVWTENEKISCASTPLFRIIGKK